MGQPWASLILWKFRIAIKEISATARTEHSEERAQQAEVREHRLCGGCQHRTVISSTGGETLRAEGGLFSVLGMHVVKDTENREGWGSGQREGEIKNGETSALIKVGKMNDIYVHNVHH